jgi:hypothetical protein
MKYIVASALAVTIFLSACGGDGTSAGSGTRSRITPTHSPSTTNTAPDSASAQGEAAVWVIEDPHSVSTESKEFTADVMRLGCSGGVTGTVLRPTIREDAAQIVVTFAVDALPPGAQTCPGNNRVPTVVKLREPIGQRQLVDGACDPGGAAASTAWCRPEFANPVRWQP